MQGRMLLGVQVSVSAFWFRRPDKQCVAKLVSAAYRWQLAGSGSLSRPQVMHWPGYGHD